MAVAAERIRRFVLFSQYGFSFDGFLFYTAIVVQILTDGLGATSLGFVAARTRNALHAATAVAAPFPVPDQRQH